MNKHQVTKLPAVEGRLETGVVQFGDDWPGVFIRGDNAMHYAHCLKEVIARANRTASVFDDLSFFSYVRGLQELLESCYAHIGERHVD